MPQLKILYAVTKTWCILINKYIKKKNHWVYRCSILRTHFFN